MNSERQNELSPAQRFPVTQFSPAEETLRLIAGLPAPGGLVDRVQAGLRGSPRTGRILQWPASLGPGGFRYSSAIRGAAAAAIVIVVAGGGWGIYSHVQPLPTGPVVATPARIGGGGFSSAGAMRTPDSPNGPVLTHALTPAPEPAASPKKDSHTATVHKHAKTHKKTAPPAARP